MAAETLERMNKIERSIPASNGHMSAIEYSSVRGLPRAGRLRPGGRRGQRRARGRRRAGARMEDAGLRGLGGAGFPAGRKWRIVREQPAPRLMAVNIDEGEPGTFKDRTYLERDPHRFLEGLLIAAQVVGTEAVYIYLRDEYHGCRATAAARAGRPAGQPAVPAAADRAAPRRGRLHLRRRVRHDREHRGQARRAAHAPALHRPGGPVRPAHAGAQLRDAVLGARHRGKGRRLVQQLRPPRAQGPAQFQRQRPRASSPASSWRRPASRCAS